MDAQPVVARPRTLRNSRIQLARALVPLGWVLAAVGYYGPWIAHKTAALTLTGSDMGEFVKFLPGVLNGSLQIVRQLFYLPPVAVVLGVALLLENRTLKYSVLLRIPALVLALVVSLQLLPPAWSPASLVATEFRLQFIALGACWLALASSWFLGGRLPLRLTALLCSGLALTAAVLPTWQLLVVRPAIGATYGIVPSAGWGYLTCLVGLAILASAGTMVATAQAHTSRYAAQASH